jgi:hypothetical protein
MSEFFLLLGCEGPRKATRKTRSVGKRVVWRGAVCSVSGIGIGSGVSSDRVVWRVGDYGSGGRIIGGG